MVAGSPASSFWRGVAGQQARAPAMSLAMSASIHCRPWNSAIGLAELAPLAGVAERGLEPGLGDADGERRDADPALVEHAHHDVEAAALLAPSRASAGSSTSSKCSAPTWRGALAHLVLLRARARRRARSSVDDEDAHARAGRPRDRCGPARSAKSAHRRVVDPELAAVEPPALRRRASAVVRMPETSEPASASVMAVGAAPLAPLSSGAR